MPPTGLFSPRGSRPADSEGAGAALPPAATLCEANGAMQSQAAFVDLASGTLPCLAQTFGFLAPPPSARPNASVDGGASSNKRRRLNEGVVGAIWQAIGLPPPPSDGSLPSPSTTTSELIAFDWQPHGMLRPPASVGSSTGASAGSRAPPLFCACVLSDDTVALYNLTEQSWSPQRLAHPAHRRLASVAWQPQASCMLAVGSARGIGLWKLAVGGTGGEEAACGRSREGVPRGVVSGRGAHLDWILTLRQYRSTPISCRAMPHFSMWLSGT